MSPGQQEMKMKKNKQKQFRLMPEDGDRPSGLKVGDTVVVQRVLKIKRGRDSMGSWTSPEIMVFKMVPPPVPECEACGTTKRRINKNGLCAACQKLATAAHG
jgi:hypothetical protein